MDYHAALSEQVNRWNLLQHPFYQAWSAGELPTQALALYAAEYGSFIAGIDRGWESVGYPEHAAEERRHAQLWEQFAQALGTHVARPQIMQTQAMLESCKRLFHSKPSALGALYAFEVQQPHTSKSKLDGLRAHYSLPETAHTYFLIHANDYHEAEDLLSDISKLSEADQEIAARACAEMCESLYHALTGVHETCGCA